jgi:hypothetical protein
MYVMYTNHPHGHGRLVMTTLPIPVQDVAIVADVNPKS